MWNESDLDLDKHHGLKQTVQPPLTDVVTLHHGYAPSGLLVGTTDNSHLLGDQTGSSRSTSQNQNVLFVPSPSSNRCTDNSPDGNIIHTRQTVMLWSAVQRPVTRIDPQVLVNH